MSRPESIAPSGRALERRVRWLLVATIIGANVIGTTIVIMLSFWVLSDVGIERGRSTGSELGVINLVAVGVFLATAIPVGTTLILRHLAAARAWIIEEREPRADEQRAVLRAPANIFLVLGTSWLVAAALFGGLNATYSAELGVRVAVTVALGGLTTCAISYLLSERLLRPVAARALAARVPERPAVPGVTARMLLTWALGSAMPIVGLVTIGVSTLVEQDFTRTQLAIAVLALGGTALFVGLVMARLGARATADPINSVRGALAEVEAGELDVEVPVYDGSEVGLLQSGFNRMVAGLRERERIRDLFGRQVGEDVARSALEGQIELGGEERDVAVLFGDIIGSTKLAATRPPHEVVELLNSFFAVVVEVVDKHGGWVNKFEGDAALAVFGVPTALDDAPGRALAAARELAARLRTEVPEVEAGIGVAAGPAVAGNVGAEQRYEYTVIGDPVNEAARLTELAKSVPGRVAASWATVERASPEEAGRWRSGEEVTLRGRVAPTTLATPT
jgi:adenylate cyclase